MKVSSCSRKVSVPKISTRIAVTTGITGRRRVTDPGDAEREDHADHQAAVAA